MNVKKTVGVMLGVMLVFYLFSAPRDAALMLEDLASGVWGLVSAAARALEVFVTTLVR